MEATEKPDPTLKSRTIIYRNRKIAKFRRFVDEMRSYGCTVAVTMPDGTTQL